VSKKKSFSPFNFWPFLTSSSQVRTTRTRTRTTRRRRSASSRPPSPSWRPGEARRPRKAASSDTAATRTAAKRTRKAPKRPRPAKSNSCWLVSPPSPFQARFSPHFRRPCLHRLPLREEGSGQERSHREKRQIFLTILMMSSFSAFSLERGERIKGRTAYTFIPSRARPPSAPRSSSSTWSAPINDKLHSHCNIEEGKRPFQLKKPRPEWTAGLSLSRLLGPAERGESPPGSTRVRARESSSSRWGASLPSSLSPLPSPASVSAETSAEEVADPENTPFRGRKDTFPPVMTTAETKETAKTTP